MINPIYSKIKKLNNNIKPSYLKYSKLAVDEGLVLLEGGQGLNINGNMFSMLKELETNPKWINYHCVFVVTQSTLASARARMNFYGFENVVLTVRNSDEYCRYLATAKYLMTDNSFPPYFNKREEQVFLNTWHGTPLKTLGMSDKSNLASLANIQKNYLMSDFALFPNEFTRNVFMQDYDLEPIFSGRSFIANYPRNYVFYDEQQAFDMKSKLGLQDKTVFAYMPTWRGTGRTANTAYQINETMAILREFDSKLSNNQVILINLHFLLSEKIDCEKFKHIKAFPSNYDTYEVLNACDGLITDYSSVFFDYAITGKKIILFAYDEENYLNSRGMYIPFESLPFPITKNVDDTLIEMAKPVEAYSQFVEEYCTNGWQDSCERIFELMVNNASPCYELKQHKVADNLCLLYVGTIPEAHFDSIKSYIKNNPEYKYVLVYRHNFTKENREFLISLGDEISSYGLVTAFQFTIPEAIAVSSRNDCNMLQSYFSREAKRLFYHIKPKKIVDFSCGNFSVAGVLSQFDAEKSLVLHGDYYCVSKIYAQREAHVKAFEKKHGFSVLDLSEQENTQYIENTAKITDADESFRKNSRMENILPIYISKKSKLKCISLFRFKTPIKIRMKDTCLKVGNKEYKAHFFATKNRLAKSHIGIYSLEIPVEDVIGMPATNMVAMCYKNKYGKLVQCHTVYCSLLGHLFLGLRGPILYDKKTNTVAIFRQSKNNRLNVYVRSYIESDKQSQRFKQLVAYIVAGLWHSKKSKNLVLLYEKNSSKYEESASVTFEKLIDSGYDNAYFIIDRNYEYIDRIPEKYRKNILYKHSFKHYLYFFKAKTFIGTEALVHAIDLKIFNILPLKKISDKNLNYVFLQHGVMYMVSLNSESRNMFNRKALNGKYRVVVSSHAEADHFTELGKHYPEDLYITGLPKFDRNELSSDADKIVIMPTWRPWEINLDRDDFTQTAYYKMVVRIYNCVPDELKDKVIILPHPLIANELKAINSDIADKMIIKARYDDILKQTRLLITDYSSIAYDAFYRGSRVIFYWEEKDYCLSQYGPSTKLMLDENNVFGDYFYDTHGLSSAIKYNYDNPQKQEYKDRYSHIVEFNDGNNTQRLIDALKTDGII